MNPLKTQAVRLLADGESNIATAEAVGVRPETISRWKSSDPEFRAEIDKIVEDAERLNVALVPAAISALESVLNNPDAHDRDRIAAARAVLDRVPIRPIQSEKDASKSIVNIIVRARDDNDAARIRAEAERSGDTFIDERRPTTIDLMKTQQSPEKMTDDDPAGEGSA